MLSYQGFSSVELHEFCCAAPSYHDTCEHNTTVSSELVAFLEVFLASLVTHVASSLESFGEKEHLVQTTR